MRTTILLFPLLTALMTVGSLSSNTNAQEMLIPPASKWQYHAAGIAVPNGWNANEFDDDAWKTGEAGFGYGDNDDRTVLNDMRGRFTSVFIRKSFEIKRLEVDDDRRLLLEINYDDGFEAFLNGKRIAQASVARAGDGTLTVVEHEARTREAFVVDKEVLVEGANVLAVAGYNHHPLSSDFSLDPILVLRNPLTKDEYLADIDELEERLLDQSSYLSLRGFDHESALSNLRKQIEKCPTFDTFVRELRKLVMQIGDCHARVDSVQPWHEIAFLPLRVADTNLGLAALKPELDEPIDADCPYIMSIDGAPLEKCLDAIASYVPSGSPQFVRARSIDWLHKIDLLRTELSLPKLATIEIGLQSADGARTKSVSLRVSKQRASSAKVAILPSRRLNANIGYVRIPAMRSEMTEPTVQTIKEFRDTDGLIIDVRYNPGGKHDILRGIYGFFVPDDAEPYVTNIAAYRLSKNFKTNHIEYRPTIRATWDGWTDAERTAIKQAAASFKPAWQLPEGKFSDWHYMVLSRARGGRTTDDEASGDYFFYDKPVVVLCNSTSFSAADNFLSAMADLPHITLVGEPSGGGSGSARRFELKNSNLSIRLSSMASFRPNGKTHDGNGVNVDISMKPTLEDFLAANDDSVLQHGIDVIRAKLDE